MSGRLWRWTATTAYWLALVPLLLFFSVLQPVDALPEAWATGRVALTLAVVVLVAAAVSWRWRRVHLALVAVCLLAGGFLYLRTQALWLEAPGPQDLRVLERTREMLRSPGAWDRSEERECPDDAASLTLYCAVRRASYEVTGGFRHRQPALQVIRRKIGELRPEADYAHRLAGFNADPEVGARELDRLLAAAIEEVRERIGSD
ncbi:MAG: hypothetical protein R2991_06645 [Thermoanaerobaculia bacterium]